MSYHIQIKMNGHVILDGVASTVMAYENIRLMTESYFSEIRDVVVKPPSLSAMFEAEIGQTFTDNWIAIRNNEMFYEARRI